jgi:hypothetical protein
MSKEHQMKFKDQICNCILNVPFKTIVNNNSNNATELQASEL